MHKTSQDHSGIEGELVVNLLDKQEYPSNIGHVAAVSDRQILVLRRDWHELTHFRLDVLEMADCRAIEYREQRVWYRILLGYACLFAAVALLVLLVAGDGELSAQAAPAVIALVALVAFGVRFGTSTRRHVIRFDMPDEMLDWRSPAIDFKLKSEAASAVREQARNRGILRQV
jgi:hypothetical protein